MGTDKRERQKARRQARLEQAEAEQRRAARRRRIGFFAVLGVLLGAAIIVSIVAGDDEGSGDVESGGGSDNGGTAPGTTFPVTSFEFGAGPCPPTEGAPEPVLEFDSAPQQCIDPAQSYLAVFDTSEGQVKVSLNTVRTPGATNNFVSLARYGYYDGSELFRTDQSIDIIQGGAPHTNSGADQGPGYTIPDEGIPFNYHAGQLVYAKPGLPGGGGAAPDSSSGQFFFTVGPNAANLDGDGTYIAFGEVVEGLDVLEAILALSEPPGANGAPSRPVTVNSVRIETLTLDQISEVLEESEGEPVIVERGGTPMTPDEEP